MKRKILLGMLITTSVLLVGCGGTQPIVEPKAQQVTSFKDYLVQKRPTPKGSYNIVAEQANKTIVETRDYNVMLAVGEDPDNITRVLDDVVGYCSLIGGTSIYGDKSIEDLGRFKHYTHLLNSDLKRHTARLDAQGKGQYSGYYKCSSPRDGFEIEHKRTNVGFSGQQSMTGGRVDFSSYYLIKHDKKQELGYAKKWLQGNKLLNKYNNGKTIQEIVSDEDGVTRYAYLLMKNANTNCTFNGGELFIANKLTSNAQMSMSDYLVSRTEQLVDKRDSIFDSKETEYVWCSNRDKSKEFSLVHKKGKLHFSQNDIGSFISSNAIKTDDSSKIELLDIDTKSDTNQFTKASKAYSTEKILAQITLGHKQDSTKDTTHISYETSYNGVNSDNCSLASVVGTNKSTGKKTIHNYKECKAGDIEYIGETNPSDIDSETIQNNYKTASQSLIANCKAQGSSIASLNEDTAIAICTQGKNVNSALKIVVIKDDKLLYKTIEN